MPTEVEKIEAAAEALLDDLDEAKLCAEEYRIVCIVGLAAVSAHRNCCEEGDAEEYKLVTEVGSAAVAAHRTCCAEMCNGCCDHEEDSWHAGPRRSAHASRPARGIERRGIMGVSTDGQICYGIFYKDSEENSDLFPWDEYDIEGWWKKVNGYVNPCPDPFDELGNYKPGFNEKCPEVSAYFRHQREWEEANPVPVELVNCCSGDYPMWIVAVPTSCRVAYRGHPEGLDPASLVVSEEDKMFLIDFCEKHIGPIPSEPQWWLSSYWG